MKTLQQCHEREIYWIVLLRRERAIAFGEQKENEKTFNQNCYHFNGIFLSRSVEVLGNEEPLFYHDYVHQKALWRNVKAAFYICSLTRTFYYWRKASRSTRFHNNWAIEKPQRKKKMCPSCWQTRLQREENGFYFCLITREMKTRISVRIKAAWKWKKFLAFNMNHLMMLHNEMT